MSRLNNIIGKTQEVFGKLMEAPTKTTNTSQTKANAPEVKPVTKTVVKPQIVVEQDPANAAKLEKVMIILTAQEDMVKSLADTVKANDEKINKVYDQLLNQKSTFDSVSNTIDQQESIMSTQIDALKEDNKQCMTQLKDVIMSKESSEGERIESIMNEAIEGLFSQQKAHTLELNRTIMSLKTSVDESTENTLDAIDKKVGSLLGAGKAIRIWILVITILNFLGLGGYVAYDLFLK